MNSFEDHNQDDQQQSAYPDLMPAIEKVRTRLKVVAEDRHPLLEKWLKQLEKIESEMRHLEKLEGLTDILTHPYNNKRD